jgi:hypothetical protein
MTFDIEHTDHPSFDELCELADGASPTAKSDARRAHVIACADCAERLAALAALRVEASRLPREVTPPAEVWTGIRAGLTPRARVARVSGWGASPWRLAAAAALIAVSSSAVTLVALRARERDSTLPPIASAPVEPPARPKPLPAQLASAELGYARSVEALRRTLDERRDSFSASTVETVERSLRVADEAIAEAREALERDPSNGVLVRIFESNYERKIDLLRRATELAPRT